MTAVSLGFTRADRSSHRPPPERDRGIAAASRGSRHVANPDGPGLQSGAASAGKFDARDLYSVVYGKRGIIAGHGVGHRGRSVRAAWFLIPLADRDGQIFDPANDRIAQASDDRSIDDQWRNVPTNQIQDESNATEKIG